MDESGSLQSSSSSGAPLPATRAGSLLGKLRRKERRRRALWNGHLTAFVSVNAFLAFLNLVTGSPTPWFLYVVGAWAIPLVPHYIHKRRRDRLQKKLEAKPDLPERLFRPFRRLHRSATHFMMGAASAGVISGYLFMINALTGGPFWSIIPAASLALPAMFHFMIFRTRRRSMMELIEAGGEDIGRLPAGARESERATAQDRPGESAAPAEHPAMADARAIAAHIRRLVETAGGDVQVELLANVDELLDELSRLCELEREFSQAEGMISLTELEKNRQELRAHKDEDLPPSSRRHYDSSLAQVEQHISSYKDLAHRHELVELRIRTGVNSLRQINLDLVRLKGDATLSEVDDLVRKKTDELSGYLSDLQESYQELSDELR